MGMETEYSTVVKPPALSGIESQSSSTLPSYCPELPPLIFTQLKIGRGMAVILPIQSKSDYEFCITLWIVKTKKRPIICFAALQTIS